MHDAFSYDPDRDENEPADDDASRFYFDRDEPIPFWPVDPT